jgi:hypothetical protein
MDRSSDRGAALERIRQELASVGPLLPGSLVIRTGPCGKQACACHQDPLRQHGPFRSWTRKVDGKTVTRLLTEDQLADYHEMFENRRRLKEIIQELEQMGLDIVEHDDRTKSVG